MDMETPGFFVQGTHVCFAGLLRFNYFIYFKLKRMVEKKI